MHPLILLHGAIGSKDQLMPLAAVLRDQFDTHLFNFNGHGGTPFSGEPFSIPLFSGELLSYMEENGIAQASLFGYSMGGYAAMHFALNHPSRVSRVVTLATKFHWDGPTAAKEVKMLNAETIQEKVPAFASELEKRHGATAWKELLEKTKELLLELGANNMLSLSDYASMATPCLVMIGDRDKMVTMEETIAVYKQLPKGQLGVLPGTAHSMEAVNVDLLGHVMKEFL